jgi:hypothetical protein
VPDERHPLDERTGRSDHAVEPPHVVVAGCVERRERTALRVRRLGPDEVLTAGARQRANGAPEALAGERRRLSLPWPEAGAPEQAFGLRRAERSAVDRRRCHVRVVTRFGPRDVNGA